MPLEIIADKHVFGLHFFSYFLRLPEEQQKSILKQIADDILNGGKIFGTSIAASIPFSQWKLALEGRNDIANQGKYLL